MKKGIKLALFGAITVVSGTTLATETAEVSSSSFIDEVCAFAPLACMVSPNQNGSGREPIPRDPKSTKEE